MKTDDGHVESVLKFIDESAAAGEWPRVVAILDSYRDDKSFVELCQRAR